MGLTGALFTGVSGLDVNQCRHLNLVVRMAVDRSHALDHVVLVLFENRSLTTRSGVCTAPRTARASMESPART